MCPSVHIILLYLALSCSILLYLAQRQFCAVSLQHQTEPTQEARAEAKFILIMPSNKEEKTTKSD